MPDWSLMIFGLHLDPMSCSANSSEFMILLFSEMAGFTFISWPFTASGVWYGKERPYGKAWVCTSVVILSKSTLCSGRSILISISLSSLWGKKKILSWVAPIRSLGCASAPISSPAVGTGLFEEGKSRTSVMTMMTRMTTMMMVVVKMTMMMISRRKNNIVRVR